MFPFDKDKELNDLIVRYEAMKTEGKQDYLDGDQLADIADWYAVERRFEEAQEVVSYGLNLHPGNTDLMVEQAYLYLDTQKVQQAKEVADSITETYVTEVKLLKAELLLNEGKLDAAEMLLDTIDDQDDLDTIIEVSYLYIDMGYPEKALPWVTKGLPLYNEEESYLNVAADCYNAGNQLEKAADYYNRLIDKNPYHPPYWMGLSKCQFAKQEFSSALESIEFALAADESFGEGHLIKAHCLFHLEREEEAIGEYEKTLQLKAMAPEFAYMFIGLALNNLEAWQRADESFQRALQAIEESGDTTFPTLSDIYSNKAISLAELGRTDEAHQLCDKAKAVSPEESEPYLLEGRIYMNEDNFDKAREMWGMALRYSPEAETWYQIGIYSMECTMIENARFCFEEAWKLNPNIDGLNEQLTSACLILRDYKAFYKYNQQSGKPMDIEGVYKSFVGLNSEIASDLRKFLDDVRAFAKEEESKKKSKNNNDNK